MRQGNIMLERPRISTTDSSDIKKGQVSFTSTRLPFELVTYIAFDNEWKATLMEKYLKSGSGNHQNSIYLHRS
jgi:predicted GIY-YIG superfamily endonuclease